MEVLMAFSVHIPPNVDLIPISPTSSWHFLYTRDFYGLFCIFTSPLVSLCLHISCLHMHVPLVTYCVHMPSLAHIFCMYGTFWLPIFTPPQVDLFTMSANSSWPILYTSIFYDLFLSLTCPLWNYFIEWYFMATRAWTSGDLFCI